MNLGDFLYKSAVKYPEKTALIIQDRRFSYRELNERVNRMAHHLQDMGVRKGDRVGFMFYNSNQFIEIYFATVKIGGVAVPLNFRMVPREVKWILDNSGCKVFAYGQACAEQVAPIKHELPKVEHLIYSGDHNAPAGEHHFESLTQEGPTKEPNVSIGLEDPVLIIYTGGTTGVPKGGVHTHASAIFNAITNVMKKKQCDSDETVIIQVPMFHNAGLYFIDTFTMLGGTLVVFNKFDGPGIMQLIEQERVTELCLLPPATYVRLLDVPNFKDFDTSSVKYLDTAAGAFSKSLVLKMLDSFPNAAISYAYGLTECWGGPVNIITREMVAQNSPKAAGVGTPLPFQEIRVVDDNGKDVPVGETGEAIIRGPNNMQGYFEQPELTAETIKNGWVHTGDLIKKDEDGFIYFVDRKKDMIKSGGENVFAVEVEQVIMGHPSVEICSVIGVPDPKFGEAVMAVIKLRPGMTATEEEITDHCKQNLSSYKKPRRFAFVDTFPVSDAGKIQKFKLREHYSK